jgi:competence protein ComEA
MTRFRRLTAVSLAMLLAFVASTGFVAAAAKPAPAGKVNINTASVEQLQALPGVGQKLAERIVEYRQKSGGFKATQDLLNVRGVGEKNFQKIQTYLSVGDAPRATGTR